MTPVGDMPGEGTRRREDMWACKDTSHRQLREDTGRCVRRRIGACRHFPKTGRAKTSQRDMGARRHFLMTRRAKTRVVAKTRGPVQRFWRTSRVKIRRNSPSCLEKFGLARGLWPFSVGAPMTDTSTAKATNAFLGPDGTA